MRRIGARHVVVMPPQVARVVTIDELEQQLRVGEQQERQTQAQLDRHRAMLADLRAQIAKFKAAPIERDDDDPEVPQADPARTAPRVRAVEAVPVPPPELTAADG
jgi:hypothetical protein